VWRSLREVKQRIPRCSRKNVVATNAACFLKVCSGRATQDSWMRAEAAGESRPMAQQAILGSQDWTPMRCADIVCDYVIEHLADDDAVLVVDETGFLKTRQSVVRSGAWQYTGSAGNDYELPDRRLRYYVCAPWSCFIDRALYLPKDWTDDPDRLGSCIRACRCRLCDQTKTCDENDRTRDSRVCAIQVGSGDTVSTVLRHRTATTSSRQRLRAWVGSAHVFRSWANDRRSPVPPQTSPDAALSDWKRLSARPNWNQRTAAARLVLSRIGPTSRRKPIQQCK